ncbi:LytTR family DNA-binding domain-containing protein [Stenotrophomonas sp. S39]|uniref:LytR/AlgR family response regulator transcription factor n=1 Tax=Stenotrophomonas sp. S39 TaxID=2767451 RepID=UPI00190C802D|nr:LytTR family DNA-binding domain-containing protein [Stenotrophomonas sp. S39]MBK0055206.1 response regulator transcription factor [Stenotrophomonas sp. S39]
MPLEALIAEDEELLRQSLVEQLGRLWPELKLVAECEDGASALEQLAEKQPDIAFLDIRMPGISGIEVARALSELSPRTQVVFVTAYDQYAIDAFEQGAMDYLLKPVSDERLLATRERVLSRLPNTRQDDAVLERLLQRLGPSQAADRPPLAWITASNGRDTQLIMLEDVVYFRADNKYTTVVTSAGESLLRTPLRELLEVLDPQHFRQVHRSTIVNMKAVAAVSRDDTGRGVLRLRQRPETLVVSQPFMSLFRGM